MLAGKRPQVLISTRTWSVGVVNNGPVLCCDYSAHLQPAGTHGQRDLFGVLCLRCASGDTRGASRGCLRSAVVAVLNDSDFDGIDYEREDAITCFAFPPHGQKSRSQNRMTSAYASQCLLGRSYAHLPLNGFISARQGLDTPYNVQFSPLHHDRNRARLYGGPVQSQTFPRQR